MRRSRFPGSVSFWGCPDPACIIGPRGDDGENQILMRLIDEQYTRTPFYGSRRMTAWLNSQGHVVNRKRVCRLMNRMGIEAIYPKKRLSRPDSRAKKYPYLLRDVVIDRPDQVWAADITYIRMRAGFHLPCCHHGLVQPLRRCLGRFHNDGGRLLRRSAHECP